MKKMKIAIFFLGALSLVACKNEVKNEATEEVVVETEEMASETTPEPLKEVMINLEAKSGSEVMGQIYAVQRDGKVILEGKIAGLKPGMHAIHIHEKADCSADDATSSGGHWNPTFEDHGKWGAVTGYHKGDIGNFEASSEGIGFIIFETDEWCIGCGDEKRDIMGKAIIVHEGVDDYTSQPSGNAGSRIACAGIIE